MKILFTYLGIILFLFSGFVITENVNAITLADGNEWELRKDKNDIKVYTRSNANSGIIEYKAITTTHAKISKLIEIINDVENFPVWMPNCESASVIENINDSLRIDYLITDVPWPMDDRDVALEVRTITNTDKHYEVLIKAVPKAIPEEENIKRIKIAKGKWELKRNDDNTIEITYQFYGDPEGNIPSWIINLFIVKGPYETLLNLKEQCSLIE